MKSNMKPPDELYWVRQQIKELKDREARLRRKLVEDETLRFGDHVVAECRNTPRRSLDLAAAEAELGSLARFDRITESVTVRLVPRIGEWS